MSLYPEELVEEVRLNNDIIEVVSEYIHLERKGSSYFGLCPFHKEKSPSFSVHPVNQYFHCFGCSKGGNVFHFIMGIENLDFVEAVRFLADRSGIMLPEPGDDREKEKSLLRKEVIEINKEAARFYYSQLGSGEGMQAQGYLKKRGLSSKIIKHFGLGYSPGNWDGLYRCLQGKQFTQRALEAGGLILKSKKGEWIDRFRNRIMFPIFDLRGNIIGFGGRVLDDSLPKYMNSPETIVYSKKRELYGLNFAKNTNSKKLVIVEGYMDVISLHQNGIDNTVASLGTALTQAQGRVLKKYAEEVVISFDADTAGQAATMRGLDILNGIGCKVKVLEIPEGKDPDEFIRKNGQQKFKKIMDGAISLVEYKIKVLKSQYNSDNMDDKLNFLNSAAEVLAQLDNNVEREMYIRKISGDYFVSNEALAAEVVKRMRIQDNKGTGMIRNSPSDIRRIDTKINDKQKGKGIYYEKLLLALLSQNNRLFPMIKQQFGWNDFVDFDSQKIAQYMYNRLESRQDIVLVELLNNLDNDTASEFVNIAEKECRYDNVEKAALDLILKLSVIKLEARKQEILELLKNTIDMHQKQALNKELTEIVLEIAKKRKA